MVAAREKKRRKTKRVTRRANADFRDGGKCLNLKNKTDYEKNETYRNGNGTSRCLHGVIVLHGLRVLLQNRSVGAAGRKLHAVPRPTNRRPH